MEDTVYRFHYRGSLKKEYGAEEMEGALGECQAVLGRLIAEGKIMTAALYHYKKMLFFYYECVGYEIKPEQLLKALSPYLERWPGQEGLRGWDEGLWYGDKYQSIALHENILFSYFEEPKAITNIQGDLEKQSEAIKEWLKVIPEDHFIHMPEGNGENFMFIPAYFALG